MPSASEYYGYLSNPYAKAFLDAIAWAEGGRSYNTMYGGGTFTGNQHPRTPVTAGGYTSSAAGRYQFLYSTWIEIKNRLGLPDFSAVNQDIAALDLIWQRGALNYVLNGQFIAALQQLGKGCAWAALPYAGCNQRERGLAETQNYYQRALQVYGAAGANVTPTIQTQNTLANNYVYDAGDLATVDVKASDNDTWIWVGLGNLALIFLG